MQTQFLFPWAALVALLSVDCAVGTSNQSNESPLGIDAGRDAKIDPDEAGAAASDYLRLFGLTALAYMWARAAEVALAQVETGADRDGFYRAKLGTARFFMERLLPQTSGLFAAIMAGGCSMMEFEDAAL